MIPTVVNKQATTLPNREVMRKLAASQPTINDYAKATPINLTETTPQVVQALRRTTSG
jgi:hypothetical protein